MDHRVVRGQVIHVNEDGWVVINRGAQDGIVEGQKFVVLGERNPRQIHNLFPAEGESQRAPAVLRVDTAYELLRVILVEHQCCVAISDRVPLERTPQPFLGPQGELLLYTPPPPDWRYDALDLKETPAEDAADDAEDEEGEEDGEEDDVVEASAATDAESGDTAEEETIDPSAQQDRLWDGALPLNALQVGDEVVLTQPYVPGAWTSGMAIAAALSPSTATPATPEPYDWFKPS